MKSSETSNEDSVPSGVPSGVPLAAIQRPSPAECIEVKLGSQLQQLGVELPEAVTNESATRHRMASPTHLVQIQILRDENG